jgi:hypothetical protein
MALRTLRSSLFLTTYCATAWLSACVAYQLFFNHVSRFTLFTHTWLAGLALLIEAPSRRADLAGVITLVHVIVFDSVVQRTVQAMRSMPCYGTCCYAECHRVSPSARVTSYAAQ